MRLNHYFKTFVLSLLFLGIGEQLSASPSPRQPEAPTISATGSRSTERQLTFSSATEDARVWLSLGGIKIEYTSPINIEHTTTLSTWATLNEVSSDTVQFTIYAGEPDLVSPSMAVTAVDGPARIVSISSPDAGVTLQYMKDMELIDYSAPISVTESTVLTARSRFVDQISNDTLYSPTALLQVEAGESIKLNPVVFSTEIYDLERGQTAVHMKSDASNILLHPDVRITYSNSATMSVLTVPNDTTIITPNCQIKAYATYPGYLNSDTTTLVLDLHTLQDVTAPSVKFSSAESNGNRIFKVKNTSVGYPAPTIYYYTEGVTSPKAATSDYVTITPSERGWVHFYAYAEGFDKSEEVIYYVDSRTSYKEPYEMLRPETGSLPENPGDLELWTPEDINLEVYPETSIKPTGKMYFHKKVHANFNDLVLPFQWTVADNIVTDKSGNVLQYKQDFWLYQIDTRLSAYNLASGTLDTDVILSGKSYLIKVHPRLDGEELIFVSKTGANFNIVQSDFFSSTSANNDILYLPNTRYQQVVVRYTFFSVNENGTAIEKHNGGIIYPFTTMIEEPYTFSYKNDSLSLMYQPELSYSPNEAERQTELSEIKITSTSYPKIVLNDAGYANGSKTIPVYRNGTLVTQGHFSRVSDVCYKLILSQKQTSDGIYTIDIPAGIFNIYRTVNDQDSFGTSAAKSLKYSILSNFDGFNVNPAPNSICQSLSQFTISCNKSISLSDSFSASILYNDAELYTFNKNAVTTTSTSIKIQMPQTATSGGLYKLIIPSGSVLLNNVPYLEDQNYQYQIPVHRDTLQVKEDAVYMLDRENISHLYNEGWLYNGNQSSTFDNQAFFLNYIDPYTDEDGYEYIDGVKISTSDDATIHMDVAGADSLVLYYFNPSPIALITNSQINSYVDLDILSNSLKSDYYTGFPVMEKQTTKNYYELRYADLKNLRDGKGRSVNRGADLKFLFEPDEECEVTTTIYEYKMINNDVNNRQYQPIYEETLTLSNGSISEVSLNLAKSVIDKMSHTVNRREGSETVAYDSVYVKISTKANIEKCFMRGAETTIYTTSFDHKSISAESFGQGVTIKEKKSGKACFRLNNQCIWHIKLYGYSQPVYAYAVKFIADRSDYAGIEQVETDDEFEDGLIYDLRGQIAEDLVPGQIYIRNGKKFLIH